MTRDDAALTAAIQHRMNGDDGAILENADLAGGAAHFERSPTCAVRHAVEIVLPHVILLPAASLRMLPAARREGSVVSSDIRS